MAEADCLFCKFGSGELTPDTVVFEDEKFLAFNDIHPKAPVHILVIPKQHLADSVNDLGPEDQADTFHLFEVAQAIAKDQGLDKLGYKLVFNVGEGGGQTIFHIHLHLLGKKAATDTLPQLA